MIPAEAVEAATDALIASKLGDHPGINGEEFVEAAMAALEAAAPHLLKQGWDEGYRAGLFDKEYYSHNRNPSMLNNEGEK